MSGERILIVDDEERNLKLFSAWLIPEGYDVAFANTGKGAVLQSKLYKPDLIILDIMMPGMWGYEACTQIKADPDTKNIPVIMVTALHDQVSRMKSLTAEASEFLSKPVDKAELLLRVKNLLKIKAFEDFMLRHNQILEDEVRQRTLELDDAFRELENMSIEMVRKLTAAAEFRDTDTGAHIARIGYYSGKLAAAMDMPADFIEAIQFTSLLHDIGKIGISDSILLKPGPLTRDEFEIMKTHSRIGAKILSDSTYPKIQMAASIALNHHERWDGGGYPGGLKEKKRRLKGE